jgi:hypothetical protein
MTVAVLSFILLTIAVPAARADPSDWASARAEANGMIDRAIHER